MAESTRIVLTAAGKAKLEDELNYLKTVKRIEVTQKIAEARSHGDLSENSEYDEAKDEEARTQGRIVELENMLDKVVVQDESVIDNGIVALGSVVTVYDPELDEEETYTIVDFTESDPLELKISPNCPIGTALMGAKVGSTVVATTPNGMVTLEIRSVARR